MSQIVSMILFSFNHKSFGSEVHLFAYSSIVLSGPEALKKRLGLHSDTVGWQLNTEPIASLISLCKLKSSAKKLCDRLHLPALVKTIDKSENSCLNVFFSAKTHKVDVPLRTIVSESGTWQHSVARCVILTFYLLTTLFLFVTRTKF